MSDLSEKTVAITGLSNETVVLGRWSCAEYDRFGTLLRTAGAGAGKVLAQIVEITDRLSVSIGKNVSLPILCCIIFETAELINDSKTVKLESHPYCIHNSLEILLVTRIDQ